MHNNKQYFSSFSLSVRSCKTWFCHPYTHWFLLYMSSTNLFILGFYYYSKIMLLMPQFIKDIVKT